ncbi:hypothetical protein BMETH_2428330401653, partial [methanotrophic bacterial endosymbiont of Bathymodiolus sp.]
MSDAPSRDKHISLSELSAYLEGTM